MKISGIISIIAGIIMFFENLNKSYEINSSISGYGKYVYSSRLDDAERGIYIGLIFLIAGMILLIVGTIKKRNSKNVNLLNTKLCLKCNKICKAEERFCPNCGNVLTTQEM